MFSVSEPNLFIDGSSLYDFQTHLYFRWSFWNPCQSVQFNQFRSWSHLKAVKLSWCSGCFLCLCAFCAYPGFWSLSTHLSKDLRGVSRVRLFPWLDFRTVHYRTFTVTLGALRIITSFEFVPGLMIFLRLGHRSWFHLIDFAVLPCSWVFSFSVQFWGLDLSLHCVGSSPSLLSSLLVLYCFVYLLDAMASTS